MSGAMMFIQDDLGISDTQQEILAGILNLCALVGSLTAGRTSDYIGRRYTILLASVLFIIGAILMGTGLFRGNFFDVIKSLKLGWRIMLGIAAVPSLVLAFVILTMPESPRWLVMQGQLGKAKKVLLQVSNTTQEAELRFKDIKVAAGLDENCNDDIVKLSEMPHQGEAPWKELILRPTPSVRWMLFAAIGIHFFEHATGIEAVMTMNAVVSMSFISIYKAITIGKALEEMEMLFTRKSSGKNVAVKTGPTQNGTI
ncbi:hypothetical protein TSUD_211120 [Trifolium subterraneum]|uniref:Major facilitator superfamily (MFS) profile domain-containing protein n=1 Tax=Trifolium subterraneum TaxID=3900 RepID=A0A2Z6NT25_TRISU|nr:hypothetical protein TSUD_211120 [Trifolium subterraneum]